MKLCRPTGSLKSEVGFPSTLLNSSSIQRLPKDSALHQDWLRMTKSRVSLADRPCFKRAGLNDFRPIMLRKRYLLGERLTSIEEKPASFLREYIHLRRTEVSKKRKR